MMKKPFFIVGCVRSGTTFLRDVLRNHPNLVSPEETHFFRWAEPFGTEASMEQLKHNAILKKHRSLDGVTEKEFEWMLRNSVSRSDLYRKYMKRYMLNNNYLSKRWFDKTPQNVYGVAMMLAEFPASKFIHIVRNPLSVAASLRAGRVLKVDNLVGACNYWNEAVEIISVVKRAYSKRVCEIKYEDITCDLNGSLKRIVEFVGEDFDGSLFDGIDAKEKPYRYEEIFSEDEIQFVKKMCGRLADGYGYTLG